MILTLELWRKTAIVQEYKTRQFCTHRHSKNSIVTWKYNEQKVFHKKAVLKNFAIFTGKHFFNKNAGLQALSFIKKKLEHRCFFANIEKLLRTPILKNICERLLLRVSLERFPTWTNNIGSEEDFFSKIKQNKNLSNTKLYEINLPFHDVFYHFVFFFFSISRQTAFALHSKRWY